MSFVFSYLLLFICFCVHYRLITSSGFIPAAIYKTKDDKYVLVRTSPNGAKTIYGIPDVDSAKELMMWRNGTKKKIDEIIPLLDDSILSNSTKAESMLPSLIESPPNFDEWLRVRITKYWILNHVDYLLEKPVIVQKMMHGALLQLPDNRIFASWV